MSLGRPQRQLIMAAATVRNRIENIKLWRRGRNSRAPRAAVRAHESFKIGDTLGKVSNLPALANFLPPPK